MSGFPNHAGELPNTVGGISSFVDIETEGRNRTDYGMTGEALVREGLAAPAMQSLVSSEI
jgi:hypothetical protein